MPSRVIRVDGEALAAAIAAVAEKFSDAPTVPITRIVRSALVLLTAVYRGDLVALPAEKMASAMKEFAARSIKDAFASDGTDCEVSWEGDVFYIKKSCPSSVPVLRSAAFQS